MSYNNYLVHTSYHSTTPLSHVRAPPIDTTSSEHIPNLSNSNNYLVLNPPLLF
eukprot:CAMPEP_0184363308 /NCGR_PEP_ID=MMETSP1089-20130417/139075_1 /TAXON_ID=38269 ORGANISM="Gloeochaete wittrockiana, Strain SAG46.84" /NCGR_SAMPLE_ID=MMETSP1089 /ASSEMBLY_ACC=CAM_ASM_000445 /LENGTH=52 /DNA_ID=CAMNT_0026703737 /DNA_START=235 /DNA_END=390 /DNA_ORIENTATION=-